MLLTRNGGSIYGGYWALWVSRSCCLFVYCMYWSMVRGDFILSIGRQCRVLGEHVLKVFIRECCCTNIVQPLLGQVNNKDK